MVKKINKRAFIVPNCSLHISIAPSTGKGDVSCFVRGKKEYWAVYHSISSSVHVGRVELALSTRISGFRRNSKSIVLCNKRHEDLELTYTNFDFVWSGRTSKEYECISPPESGIGWFLSTGHRTFGPFSGKTGKASWLGTSFSKVSHLKDLSQNCWAVSQQIYLKLFSHKKVSEFCPTGIKFDPHLNTGQVQTKTSLKRCDFCKKNQINNQVCLRRCLNAHFQDKFLRSGPKAKASHVVVLRLDFGGNSERRETCGATGRHQNMQHVRKTSSRTGHGETTVLFVVDCRILSGTLALVSSTSEQEMCCCWSRFVLTDWYTRCCLQFVVFGLSADCSRLQIHFRLQHDWSRRTDPKIWKHF